MVAYMIELFAAAIAYFGNDFIAKLLVTVIVCGVLYAIKWIYYRLPVKAPRNIESCAEVLAGFMLYTLFTVCGWGFVAFFIGLYTSFISFCLLVDGLNEVFVKDPRFA